MVGPSELVQSGRWWMVWVREEEKPNGMNWECVDAYPFILSPVSAFVPLGQLKKARCHGSWLWFIEAVMTVLMDKCFTKKPKIQQQRLPLGIWISSLLQDFVWWLVEMSWSWDEVRWVP